MTSDLVASRPVLHVAGPAVDVLCASAALPGLFPPVRLPDGGLHVDGGILAPDPVPYALADDPGLVFQLTCGTRPLVQPRTALSVVLAAVDAARQRIGELSRVDDPRVVVLPGTHGSIRDFTRTDAHIAVGHRAATARLAALTDHRRSRPPRPRVSPWRPPPLPTRPARERG